MFIRHPALRSVTALCGSSLLWHCSSEQPTAAPTRDEASQLSPAPAEPPPASDAEQPTGAEPTSPNREGNPMLQGNVEPGAPEPTPGTPDPGATMPPPAD